jgi:hypothetical protein
LTNPTVIHRFQDNRAVADAQDGEAVEGDAAADTAAPHLAAIQHSYEAAKANIVDPAPVWSQADDDEPFPATEKIDGRMVTLPPVPDEAAGTEAMSVAARLVAEQLAVEEAASPASGPGKPEAPSAEVPRRRRWWRAIRSAPDVAVPEDRPEA